MYIWVVIRQLKTSNLRYLLHTDSFSPGDGSRSGGSVYRLVYSVIFTETFGVHKDSLCTHWPSASVDSVCGVME